MHHLSCIENSSLPLKKMMWKNSIHYFPNNQLNTQLSQPGPLSDLGLKLKRSCQTQIHCWGCVVFYFLWVVTVNLQPYIKNYLHRTNSNILYMLLRTCSLNLFFVIVKISWTISWDSNDYMSVWDQSHYQHYWIFGVSGKWTCKNTIWGWAGQNLN